MTEATPTHSEVDSVNDEIIEACCKALDKAHSLLSFIVRYDGKCTPQFVEACRVWVDGEYDPGERQPKRCAHNWVKAALDNSMWCSRCGIKHSTDRQ